MFVEFGGYNFLKPSHGGESTQNSYRPGNRVLFEIRAPDANQPAAGVRPGDIYTSLIAKRNGILLCKVVDADEFLKSCTSETAHVNY